MKTEIETKSNQIGYTKILNTVAGSKLYYAFQGALAPYLREDLEETAEGDTRAMSTLPPKFNEYCRGLAVYHVVKNMPSEPYIALMDYLTDIEDEIFSAVTVIRELKVLEEYKQFTNVLDFKDIKDD